ncbi:MAG: hypothetical protein WKF83_07080 [Nocardioidaceae bacterium]
MPLVVKHSQVDRPDRAVLQPHGARRSGADRVVDGRGAVHRGDAGAFDLGLVRLGELALGFGGVDRRPFIAAAARGEQKQRRRGAARDRRRYLHVSTLAADVDLPGPTQDGENVRGDGRPW